MSKFNVTESLNKDDMQGRFLMSALADILKDKEKRDILMYKDALGNVTWDIKLTANGVELEFTEVLDRWVGQWDQCLKKEAKELIDASFGNILNEIDDMRNELKHRLLDMAYKKLGITIDE